MIMRTLVLIGSIALILSAASHAAAQPQVPVGPYAAHQNVWHAVFSTDGRRLASGCGARGEAAICIFDLEAGELTAVVPAPQGGDIRDFF